VTEQIYDTLINFEPGESTLTDGLASDYSLDGETASLTLKEGVTFHNGEEFTAQDFEATYRRFVDSEYEYYAGDDYVSAYGPFTLGNWIDEIQVDGDYEMTIQLTQTYAPFLRNLAMFAAAVHPRPPSRSTAPTCPKTRSERGRSSSTPSTTPTSRSDSTRTTTTGATARRSTKPFSSRSARTPPERSRSRAENSTLSTGSARSPPSRSKAPTAPNWSAPEGINIGYMAFNIAAVEEFQDRRVRQAVSHAINTEAIVNQIYAGFATEASQPLPPNVLGHNDDIEPYPYDPEQAQSLLEEAGYGDGFSFELATFQNPRGYNPSPLQTAETVASNLGEVGIEVEINQQSFAPFLEYTAQGRHDACFLGWYTDNADPDNFAYVLLHPQVERERTHRGPGLGELRYRGVQHE